MSSAYLDSSFLVAILLGEPRARALQRILERFDDWIAGDLLIAETLATAEREGLPSEFVARGGRADLAFLSRDAPQRGLARRLGFETP